jgi:alginate O-acetyltransferase complex protein AlgI
MQGGGIAALILKGDFTLVFSRPLFVFVFLPAVLLLYFLVPKRFLPLRNLVLLGFSLGFYFIGEPKYVLVMLGSILINYLFGYGIGLRQAKGQTGKVLLILSLVINLGGLVFFKYLTFLTENINWLFGSAVELPRIIMPIGISFFTFQAMSYVFDVYRKTVDTQKNPLNVALYVSMFPQLIAGPIVRYETIANEIKKRDTNIEKFAEGAARFIYGLAKKVVLADAMGQIADAVFNRPVQDMPGTVAWMGALAYSFQIFYDFSGYSDMGIGLGKMFGFTFLENFNFPYISKSVTEFWRRWHISLGTWFRDYLYIPLGGNRAGALRQIANLFIVWLLTGFWHGAAWNFVAWGLFYFVFLTTEKLLQKKFNLSFKNPLFHLYALLLVVVGWVLFRSESITYAVGFLGKMFNPVSAFAGSGEALYYLLEYAPEWILAVVFSMPVGLTLTRAAERFKRGRTVVESVRLVYLFAVFLIAAMTVVTSNFSPFIYFRF